MLDSYLSALCQYAVRTGLIQTDDVVCCRNALLEALALDSFDEAAAPAEAPLAELLQTLTDDAVSRGVCPDNQTARDLFDTKLMGVLTPRPHEVRTSFRTLYEVSPREATDWFYRFSQDTNYIRRDRIAKDKKWTYTCEYGTLDITINLSKPEKDPRAIAAAKNAPQSGYPKCALCAENEGYAGRMNHPARQNHRVIPLQLDGVVCGSAFLGMLGLMGAMTILGWFPLGVLPAALAGALMALLLWNFPPAKLLPGSVGSLFLAGALGCVPLSIGWPGLSVPLGLPYWLEGGMVALQILVYQASKGRKQLFGTAPLHRWLEKRGRAPISIFYTFCVFAMLGVALAMQMAKIS